MGWIGVAVLGAAGAVVGFLGRWLLGRAEPPAPVPPWCCELGTGLLWAATAAWYLMRDSLPGSWLVVPLALTALAVPLAAADLRHRRLPNTLTLPAYPLLALALAAVAAATGSVQPLIRAACAAVVFGGAHAVVRWYRPHALGGGDVKLAGSLGGVLGALGWAALPVAACLGAITSVLLAVGAAMFGRRAWREGVPHGPGLLAATVLVVFVSG